MKWTQTAHNHNYLRAAQGFKKKNRSPARIGSTIPTKTKVNPQSSGPFEETGQQTSFPYFQLYQHLHSKSNKSKKGDEAALLQLLNKSFAQNQPKGAKDFRKKEPKWLGLTQDVPQNQPDSMRPISKDTINTEHE